MHTYIYIYIYIYRICTSCSKREANVYADVHNICLTYTPACMVLNNTYECMPTLRKNAYGLMHACLCNNVAASLPWKLLRTYLESCANIVQAVFYHLPSCRPPSCHPSSCWRPCSVQIHASS